MITYIINFVLCSGLLLLVYRLFLQGERMYRFNRFYLLFSLVFSLVVPIISIPMPFQSTELYHAEYTIDLPGGVPAQPQAAQPVPVAQVATPPPPIRDILPMVLGLLYISVFAVLLFRFGRNLYHLNRVVKEGDVVDHQQNKLILTPQNVTPHSFLKYIFINRDDYNDGGVEPEIICHEETHIRQRHSLDVLFVEVLQIVFWFNPFIPFYRRAIRLNHEFLADEAVVQAYNDTLSYQSLLLAKACLSSSLRLTSPFNYQTTKKRLIMMTKTTSAKIALSKQIALAPVLGIALFLFCNGVTAQTKLVPPAIAKTDTIEKLLSLHSSPPRLKEAMRVKYAAVDAPQSIMDAFNVILKKYGIPHQLRPADVSPADKEKLEALYVQMSKSQQDRQEVGFGKAGLPMAKNTVSAAQMEKWKDKNYFVRINYKRISNKDLVNYKPEDFDHVMVNPAGEWAFKHNGGVKYFVDLMTKPYYADYYKKIMADRSDVMWEYKAAQNPPKPKVTQVRFPPPVVRPDGAPKPKVTQVRFPPPIVKPDPGFLVVVDGAPVGISLPSGYKIGGPNKVGFPALDSLKASDVTSYSILKDAAAVKLFGQRAAGGVLIITTIKGKKQ